ncbi:MAG: hypothetical protein M3Z31_18620 [Pseudomonadota bacterium]|nr:hypothetical protein [Pseudomonadota bacterium]
MLTRRLRNAALKCALIALSASAAAADGPFVQPVRGDRWQDELLPPRLSGPFTAHRHEMVQLAAAAAEDDAEPGSLDELFGSDKAKAPQAAVEKGFGGVRGYVQTEVARTIASPVHWSKLLTRADLGAEGRFSPSVKWKAEVRLDYDAVYDLTDFYPDRVRRDQRVNILARENYLDIDAGGDWDFRIGRQHVVWGEMVGLFFADVVSAKDLREFVLPDFDVLRIPQWAARAEYSKNDWHAELVWIPVPSYDEIGKPGAEFYPFVPPTPAGYQVRIADELRPNRSLQNTNYGARLSTLRNGWDVSAFYYRSMDASPTFYREVVLAPEPTYVYQARHDRIQQWGATIAKDFGAFVLKSEGVYTRGRRYDVLRPKDPDLVQKPTLDWAVGLDFSLPADTRLNLQAFQRVFFEHEREMIPDRYENGYSVLLNRRFTEHLEAQALWIASFNRNDWIFRPRVMWTFQKNWRWAVGMDVFNGPPTGFAGRFDNRDRAYTELRYSF